MSSELVTEEMLQAAVSEAVRQGLLPKSAFADSIAEYYEKVKAVLQAAMNADRR